MDRTGWTPLQVAWANHAHAESVVHDLTNQLADSEYDITLASEPGLAGVDHTAVGCARRHRDFIAEQLTAARATLVTAEDAYLAEQRLTRRQFADLLGVAPSTLSAYVARDQAPQPDGRDQHGHPWWTGTTAHTYAGRARTPGVRGR